MLLYMRMPRAVAGHTHSCCHAPPSPPSVHTRYWNPGCGGEFATTPLPLFNGTEIVEQPVDLSTLTERYADAASAFIGAAAAALDPFALILAFQHVVSTNAANAATKRPEDV